MPYGHVWNDTDPPGTELAKNIDDQIRLLRSEIHERMDDVVVDWTADPVVPISPIASDLVRIIPAAAFLNDYHGAAGVGVFGGHVKGAVGTGIHLAPLGNVLPKGCTITKVEFAVTLAGTGAITVTAKLLESGDFATTPFLDPTALETLTTSTVGDNLMDTGAISHVVDTTTKIYSLSLEATAGVADTLFTIWGVRVTFTL